MPFIQSPREPNLAVSLLAQRSYAEPGPGKYFPIWTNFADHVIGSGRSGRTSPLRFHPPTPLVRPKSWAQVCVCEVCVSTSGAMPSAWAAEGRVRSKYHDIQQSKLGTGK